jgi:hypothetical protein
MGFMDLLEQYANATAGQSVAAAPDHFHEVAQSAPQSVVAQGISAALSSSETPPFGQMVSQLFSQANSSQQAGMVNQLLGALGTGGASGAMGGILGSLLPALGGAGQLSPQQAAQMTPQQVQQLAEHAQQQNPSVIDTMGGFYAQHPQLVRTIGSAALTIALAKIAENMRG